MDLEGAWTLCPLVTVAVGSDLTGCAGQSLFLPERHIGTELEGHPHPTSHHAGHQLLQHSVASTLTGGHHEGSLSRVGRGRPLELSGRGEIKTRTRWWAPGPLGLDAPS